MNDTRENWLNEAAQTLGEFVLEKTGMACPAIQVSPGWPSKGGPEGRILGECWDEVMTAEGTRHIFLNPILGNNDLSRLLDVLLHEMLHAICDSHYDDRCQHDVRFARAAKAVGLSGKPTSTYAEVGGELHLYLLTIVDELGEYPGSDIQMTEGMKRAIEKGAKIDKKKIKKGTRSGHWVKFESETLDNYLVRVSPVSLREHGVPRDPKGHEMKCVDKRYNSKGEKI